MKAIRVGLIGCGAIGSVLAQHICKGNDFLLLHIFDSNQAKAEQLVLKLQKKPTVAERIEEMFDSDLVIEAASQNAVREFALKILDHCDLMIMSVGALADNELFAQIKKKAVEKNRRVFIPSGAICGLDGVKSASAGKIETVTLSTTKPPLSLEGAPWIKEKGIDLGSIKEPSVIFEGSAKEAAKWFPANINVSVALSLAGIGVEKTRVKIIADPAADVNTHEIAVEGSFGKMAMTTKNRPFPENPKTSYLAALSAIATLNKIKENISIGT
jgi:aspartate dehydrogenase